MNVAGPGWMRDPSGRHELRYWDGKNWTEHVSNQGQVALDPTSGDPSSACDSGAAAPQLTSASTEQTTEKPIVGVVGAQVANPPREKVTAFNAKRIALSLQEENAYLTGALAELGALDSAQRSRRIQELRHDEAALAQQVFELRCQIGSLESEVIVLRDRLILEEMGMFDYEHAAEQSPLLAAELESLRSRIREMNKIGSAITANQQFSFNDSAAKGRTFVNQMSRIMLRSYNAEAENAIKTVKAGNLASAQKRLETARSQIAKQGSLIQLSIADEYHALRSRELALASAHHQAVAAARELDRERRAELREQKAVEAELKREKERLDKERMHYLNSIQKLRDAGDVEGANGLQAELDRVEQEIAQADYRAANIRAGYVYVISNIGAFGEGTVKIGMTRRLDPMDRVRELGDASVPFRFDVHALFFSDDAVGVEAMLHREFADYRLNKVNPRREFFRVSPQQVLDALNHHNVSVLEFTSHALAEDFRMSWPEGYPTVEHRNETSPQLS